MTSGSDKKPASPLTDLRRRRVLQGVGAGMLVGGTVNAGYGATGWEPGLARRSSLFTLGVAAGDSRSDRTFLWTRLAPDPLNGGGMGTEPADVQWELATDPDFNDVVRAGTTTARPENGHSLLVPIYELPSNTEFFYRFNFQGELSRTGRTRTFPGPLTSPDRMRFALASCQDYEAGFFAAWRDIAEQDLDFVLHVGDYIYEYATNPDTPSDRQHLGGEIVTVDDYRNRYAQYRLDPNLQDAHAAHPFIVTWDDHEVDNNYAGLTPEDDQSPQAFAERRANAYKVYRESMPLGVRQVFDGTNLRLFRRFNFGRLAQLHVLDTRQFRDDQPCDDVFPAFLSDCPELADPDATMTGETQEQWLYRGLSTRQPTWNVLAQQVQMLRWDLGSVIGLSDAYNPDSWDGYQGARQRIIDFLAAEQPNNPVVLTGDIHSAWASDIKADFADPASATVASEFVCTSITSVFGDENVPLVDLTLPANPHIKYFDGLQRGYALCEVTPDFWRTDFRGVERIEDPNFTVPSPDLPVSTIASWGVQEGTPGVVPV